MSPRPVKTAADVHPGVTAAASDGRMTPRYIAARRPDGSPSRHLTARQLRRMRERFHRTGALLALLTVLAACVGR